MTLIHYSEVVQLTYCMKRIIQNLNHLWPQPGN